MTSTTVRAGTLALAAGERESATGPVDGYAARRSATATQTDTPLNEVPQSITAIGAEQIRDQNAQTMPEVLRYVVGVRSEMYGLDNRGDWFTLRGGSEGSVLLDGLRVPLFAEYQKDRTGNANAFFPIEGTLRHNLRHDRAGTNSDTDGGAEHRAHHRQDRHRHLPVARRLLVRHPAQGDGDGLLPLVGTHGRGGKIPLRCASRWPTIRRSTSSAIRTCRSS
jgi:TonB-dependent Receptor Plug Domain